MLNKWLALCTTMGILKVNEVKPRQDAGASEVIDLNQDTFIWEVAKLTCAGYCVDLGFSLIFFYTWWFLTI